MHGVWQGYGRGDLVNIAVDYLAGLLPLRDVVSLQPVAPAAKGS